jgi:hypothetical protein
MFTRNPVSRNVVGTVTRFRHSFRVQCLQFANAESARGAAFGAGSGQPDTIVLAVFIPTQFQQFDFVAVPVTVAFTLEEQLRRFQQLLQLRFAQSAHALAHPTTETSALALAASSASSGAEQSAPSAGFVRGPGSSLLELERTGLGTIAGGPPGCGRSGRLQDTLGAVRHLHAAATDQ